MYDIPTEWIRGPVLGPAEAAQVFNVTTRTITRWAQDGVIGFFRSPRNGTRCYPECEVQRVVNGEPADPIVKLLAEQDKRIYRKKWEEGWHQGAFMKAVFDASQAAREAKGEQQ